MTRWLVVQCELARAIARHADTHETKQDGHSWCGRALPALQHCLGCLSLKKRARVTTTEEAMTSITGHHHHQREWRPRHRVSNVSSGSGSSRIRKEVTLVTHLPHPSNSLTTREQTYKSLHFCKVWIYTQPTHTAFGFVSVLWLVWSLLRIMSQSQICPKVRYKVSYLLSS